VNACKTGKLIADAFATDDVLKHIDQALSCALVGYPDGDGLAEKLTKAQAMRMRSISNEVIAMCAEDEFDEPPDANDSASDATSGLASVSIPTTPAEGESGRGSSFAELAALAARVKLLEDEIELLHTDYATHQHIYQPGGHGSVAAGTTGPINKVERGNQNPADIHFHRGGH
jgi:hypothetical protein